MVSIYDWFGYEIPIQKRYQWIKEAGFDGVLLWWSDGFGRGANYRDGVTYARDAKLEIENIHTPIEHQNDLWLDNLAGEALLKCYLQCIRDCAEFEIPAMVIHLPDECYHIQGNSFDRIKKIADCAEKLGINVAMENLRNLSNLKYVLDHTDSKRIGYCYDACHHANYCQDEDLLGEYGSRLMAIHLHDNGGDRKQHQLPFDGSINWSEVMNKIAKTGYTGATALEPMNWDYLSLTPKEFLKRAYEKVKKLERLRGESNEGIDRILSSK
ncbi:sugar phosphate isomerases/epimerases [Lachnospiraceae bacterium KM106-2]|nr:sugar phosphate isomerases/epimerases [Lachnospiraceae bacterium KM106-2]